MLSLAYKRVFVVLLATGMALNFFLTWSDWGELRRGYADFTIFYSAAQIVRSARGEDLYDVQTQWQAQLASAPDVSIRHGALPYNHPPFEALIFVPFTFLPYFSAYLAWGAVNIAILLIVIWLVRRRSERLRKVSWPVLSLIAFSFFPVFMCLFQGQDVILLLLLITGAYTFIKDRSDLKAGLVLGAGMFRPQLVLPLALLVLCMKRTKRFAAGVVLSTAAMAAVSIAVVGWRSFVAYPKYVWKIERALGNGAIVPSNMPNLRGLFSFLHEGSLSVFVVTGLSSILLFAYAARLFRSSQGRLNLESSFIVAVLVALLVSYHLLIYDLALLFLPLLLIYQEWDAFSNRVFSAARNWMVVGPIGFLFCTPLLMWLWLHWAHFNVVAIVLLAWLLGICSFLARENACRGEILVTGA